MIPAFLLVMGKPWRGIPEFRVMGGAHSELKAQPRHGKTGASARRVWEHKAKEPKVFESREQRVRLNMERRAKKLAAQRETRLLAAFRQADETMATMPGAWFVGSRESMLVYPDSVVIQKATSSGEVREKRYALKDVEKFLRSYDEGESVAIVPKNSSIVILDVSANPWAVSALPDENPQFWRQIAALAPEIPVDTVKSPGAAIAELCRGTRDPIRLAELPFEVGYTKFPDFSASRIVHNDYDSIAVDSGRNKIAIFNKEFMAGRVYEAADIMSVEVYEDGRSISQASRTRQIGAAMVGNFIAGSAGALIGGLGAKTSSRDEIRALTLRLTLDDAEFPIFDLQLNRSVLLKGSVPHAELSVVARGWASLLEATMRNSEPRSQTPNSVEGEPPANIPVQSLADELGKLSALRASGILTDEEFTMLKQRLIS
jgi:predicted GIY-YIG superfamily endonuclease